MQWTVLERITKLFKIFQHTVYQRQDMDVYGNFMELPCAIQVQSTCSRGHTLWGPSPQHFSRPSCRMAILQELRNVQTLTSLPTFPIGFLWVVYSSLPFGLLHPFASFRSFGKKLEKDFADCETSAKSPIPPVSKDVSLSVLHLQKKNCPNRME